MNVSIFEEALRTVYILSSDAVVDLHYAHRQDAVQIFTMRTDRMECRSSLCTQTGCSADLYYAHRQDAVLPIFIYMY